MKRNIALSIILFVVSIAAVITAFYFQEQLSNFQSLGLVGIFLINFFSSATLFLPAPGFLSVFAGGVIYNPIFVSIVASLGSALGDLVGYLMGYSGRKLFVHKLHKKKWFKTVTYLFHKYGPFALFMFALIPNPLFDSIGIIAGVFGYSAKRFVAIVFAGRLVRYLLIALGGSFF